MKGLTGMSDDLIYAIPRDALTAADLRVLEAIRDGDPPTTAEEMQVFAEQMTERDECVQAGRRRYGKAQKKKSEHGSKVGGGLC